MALGLSILESIAELPNHGNARASAWMTADFFIKQRPVAGPSHTVMRSQRSLFSMGMLWVLPMIAGTVQADTASSPDGAVSSFIVLCDCATPEARTRIQQAIKSTGGYVRYTYENLGGFAVEAPDSVSPVQLEQQLRRIKGVSLVEPDGESHTSSPPSSADRSAINNSSRMNDIPPRLQWEANYGYCGETALISAGLYYGQYASQFDTRAIASPGIKQSRRGSQLLLGVNDEAAAAHVHLKAVEWDSSVTTTNANNFLAWVKGNVVSGYPVIIGVYENFSKFDDSEDEDAGDNEYDHIVPVIGVSSAKPGTQPAAYDADDVVTLSDNGLWSPDGQPAFIYRFKFGAFQATRQQANDEARPVYSLPGEGKNYGVAITGVMDRDGKTLPVRLTTDVNQERPAMDEGSNTRPASATVNLTAMVSGLTPGVRYTLYRYDSFDNVPESGFNEKSAAADKRWDINIKSGSTYVVKEAIRSDQVAVYRAVPVTAP